MDYRTEQLILHFVTEEDLAEVARAWWSDHRPVSEEEAKGAIAYMRGNYEKNTKGRPGRQQKPDGAGDLYPAG